eukprot:3609802-Prymnesium_polylepis.2
MLSQAWRRAECVRWARGRPRLLASGHAAGSATRGTVIRPRQATLPRAPREKPSSARRAREGPSSPILPEGAPPNHSA